ncbi:MAG: class I SAM-dependent methyltransferase [Stellaceae bacterium]
MSAVWRDEVREIYAKYAIYDQSGGGEQKVFDAVGTGVSRSSRVVEFLTPHCLGEALRLLDIGCGNGAFLRAVSDRYPEWRLNGTEFDTRHREEVLRISGVEAFHAGPLTALGGSFDVISLVHVLEHIEHPGVLLREIAARLNPGGLLLIEVPNRDLNPFDLLIADHCTHFDLTTLADLLNAAGFDVIHATDTVVPKELSAVAWVSGASPTARSRRSDARQRFEETEAALRWLRSVAHQADAMAKSDRPFGIFGTSIAATWLDSTLGEGAVFFVDEDPGRVGRRWRGRPVLGPGEVAPGADVFVPLAGEAAQRVARRLNGAARYIAPAPFRTGE